MEPLDKRMNPLQLIAHIRQLLYDKSLVDISGGNISMRSGDQLFFSPTGSGLLYHWCLDAENIVQGYMKDTQSLLDDPQFTKEGHSHLKIYQEFPFVHGIIHAHPKYLFPFIAKEAPLPPVLRSNDSYGVLQYHEAAEPYSEDQANKIVKVFWGQEDRLTTKGAAVLMPRHGIIVAAKKILVALDCLDRIHNNAFAVLFGKLI